jgi:hypothetical protein
MPSGEDYFEHKELYFLFNMINRKFSCTFFLFICIFSSLVLDSKMIPCMLYLSYFREVKTAPCEYGILKAKSVLLFSRSIFQR